MELKPGQVIFHYELLELLGSSGMSVVYKALDKKLDRYVALKFLTHQTKVADKEKERFFQEAKTTSSLDHPNICTIYEINQTPQGRVSIAMAFYEGEKQLFSGIGKNAGLEVAGPVAELLTDEWRR